MRPCLASLAKAASELEQLSKVVPTQTLRTVIMRSLKEDPRYKDVLRDVHNNPEWHFATIVQHVEHAAHREDDLLAIAKGGTIFGARLAQTKSPGDHGPLLQPKGVAYRHHFSTVIRPTERPTTAEAHGYTVLWSSTGPTPMMTTMRTPSLTATATPYTSIRPGHTRRSGIPLTSPRPRAKGTSKKGTSV